MWWIVGLLVTIGFGWLMYTNERFRKFGFGVISLIALALVVLWYTGESQNRKFRAERQRSLTAITNQELTIRDLQLSENQFGWRLQGSVLNNSRYPIQRLTLQVRLKDCPNPTGDAGCVVVGEDDARFYVEVPPGQARQLDTSVTFANMSRINGYWAWHYAVTEIEAKLD